MRLKELGLPKEIKKKTETMRRYRKNNPWAKHMAYINNRCNLHPDYNGIRRKIVNNLTMNDIRFLWERDKPFEMDKPSIARKNPKLHYTIDNCVFMELRENQRQPKDIYARFKGQKTKGRWSIHYDKCVICGSTKYRYNSKGRCNRYKCRHSNLKHIIRRKK